MSMPPEASGPVFTVIRPTRIGPLCPRTTAGKLSAEAPNPAAWMKRLRVNAMVSLLGRDSVGRVLRCVGLLEWLRAVEGLDFHAFPENAHDRGHALRADEPDPLNRDQGGIPWHSPAGVSSKRPGSALPRWASPASSGDKADRSESA